MVPVSPCRVFSPCSTRSLVVRVVRFSRSMSALSNKSLRCIDVLLGDAFEAS